MCRCHTRARGGVLCSAQHAARGMAPPPTPPPRLVANYLSLGQLELARATLRALEGSDAALAREVVRKAARGEVRAAVLPAPRGALGGVGG